MKCVHIFVMAFCCHHLYHSWARFSSSIWIVLIGSLSVFKMWSEFVFFLLPFHFSFLTLSACVHCLSYDMAWQNRAHMCTTIIGNEFNKLIEYFFFIESSLFYFFFFLLLLCMCVWWHGHYSKKLIKQFSFCNFIAFVSGAVVLTQGFNYLHFIVCVIVSALAYEIYGQLATILCEKIKNEMPANVFSSIMHLSFPSLQMFISSTLSLLLLFGPILSNSHHILSLCALFFSHTQCIIRFTFFVFNAAAQKWVPIHLFIPLFLRSTSLFHIISFHLYENDEEQW